MPVCWLATAGMVPFNIMTTSLPKRGQVAMLAGAKALAEPDQHQQRAHAPGDAEHGQEGAQLVGCNGAEDLAESVGKALHNRSTGLTSFWSA